MPMYHDHDHHHYHFYKIQYSRENGMAQKYVNYLLQCVSSLLVVRRLLLVLKFVQELNVPVCVACSLRVV